MDVSINVSGGHRITIVPSLHRRLSLEDVSNLPRTYKFKFPSRENTF